MSNETLHRFNPPTVAPPNSRYSHGIVHSLCDGLRRLVISGQVGIALDGSLVGDLRGQIEQAWDNVLAVLAAENMAPRDLVKVTTFLTDGSPEAIRMTREIRTRKLGDCAPASTLLVVAGLANPGFKVEIEAEAIARA
jgi:enamine deaminase RidA (YjgF/YER057c/UK114 family)